MALVTRHKLKVDKRRLKQSASMAIKDVYDAIVELVTNSDDRYELLGIEGKIEIEVRRRRKKPSTLRVRDFADGMDNSDMERKLGSTGGRVSGMEKGLAVRGTNSRGAKDVAALGMVTFESIAGDHKLHTSRITPQFVFELEAEQVASPAIRKRLRIPKGTGTLVTMEVDPEHSIPYHENLLENVSLLVPLRDIIRNPRRTVILRDLQQKREDAVTFPNLDGTKRLAKRFSIPGYEGAEAKLLVHRASDRFEPKSSRFRQSGILIKSRHAIHEATFFDPALESDPCALWFYGRLTCEYLDDLWNDWDERYADELPHQESNPLPVIDPGRKAGLTRQHPFVKELFRQALRRFRPLVEEERQREANERTRVESRETRRRLDDLEKAANEFMAEYADEPEQSRDPDGEQTGSRFREHGFMVSPPFAQLCVGHSRRCWLSVSQAAFPELEVGSNVQLESLTSDITLSRRFASLNQHPTQSEVLRAIWKVSAENATPATGVKVTIGPIVGEITLEILESEADKYADVTALQFQHQRYNIRRDTGRKRLRLLAPISLVEEAGTEPAITPANRLYEISGSSQLVVRDKLNVAMAEFYVQATNENLVTSSVEARLGGQTAFCKVVPKEPAGAGITITLEDVDHGNQRYRWHKNVLEIAARHPSIKRYLGSDRDQFKGQEQKHFRVLLAEIVADAVCSSLLRHQIEKNPEEYENADWDLYYAEFSRLMTKFLPKAHTLVVPAV